MGSLVGLKYPQITGGPRTNSPQGGNLDGYDATTISAGTAELDGRSSTVKPTPLERGIE